MAQPILTIRSDDKMPKAVANLLPCRIHHNGSVDPVATFWTPKETKDGTKLAYFRGRKLQGKTVKLPEQYRGVVLERRDKNKDNKQSAALDADVGIVEDEKVGGEGTMRATAAFDEMVIWGHEAVADAASDPYVRSMEEWLQVANEIHSYDTEQK